MNRIILGIVLIFVYSLSGQTQQISSLDPSNAIALISNATNAFDVTRITEEQLIPRACYFGDFWPFWEDSLIDGLKQRNSDYLYFLAYSASLNPEISKAFLEKLLNGDYLDFKGKRSPLDAERIVLTLVDLPLYIPSYKHIFQACNSMDTLLLLRNLGRSKCDQRNRYENLIGQTLLRESTPEIGLYEGIRGLSKRLRKRPCNTPHLDEYLVNWNQPDEDTDRDGVENGVDSNPIQSPKASPLSVDQTLCSTAIGLKILEHKDERGQPLVIVITPAPLGFEIPVPSGMKVLNILASDFDSTLPWAGPWIEISLLSNMGGSMENRPSRPLNMPSDAIDFFCSGKCAVVYVAERHLENLNKTWYAFVLREGRWRLHEIYIENTPMPFFTVEKWKKCCD